MELMTRTEVAEYFRVHERTVDRWIESGNLKSYKLGTGRTALLRIPKVEVEAFLKKSITKNTLKNRPKKAKS